MKKWSIAALEWREIWTEGEEEEEVVDFCREIVARVLK